MFRSLKSYFKKSPAVFTLAYAAAAALILKSSFASPAVIFTPFSRLHTVSYCALTFLSVLTLCGAYQMRIRNSGTESIPDYKPLISVRYILTALTAALLFAFFNFCTLDSLKLSDRIGSSYSMIYVRSFDVLTAAFNLGEFTDPLRGKVLLTGLLPSVWLSYLDMILGSASRNIALLKVFQNLVGLVLMDRLLKYFATSGVFRLSLCFMLFLSLLSFTASDAVNPDLFLSSLFLLYSVHLYRTNTDESLQKDLFASAFGFAFIYHSKLDPAPAVIYFGLQTFFFLRRSSPKNRTILLLTLFFYLPFLFQLDSLFAQNLSLDIAINTGIHTAQLPAALLKVCLLTVPAAALFFKNRSSAAGSVLTSSILGAAVSLFSTASGTNPGYGLPVSCALTACAPLIVVYLSRLNSRVTARGLTALCAVAAAVLLIVSIRFGTSDADAEKLMQEIRSYPPENTLIITPDSEYFLAAGYSAIPPDLIPYVMSKIEYRIRNRMIRHILFLAEGYPETRYPHLFRKFTVISGPKDIVLSRHGSHRLMEVTLIDE